ncbi:MAG: hypothetical protein WEB58_03500 [Planctomycetaceae bacterium]
MAKCDQGYLCDVCGDEVDNIKESDLYLRYVIGEIDGQALLTQPERHITCNPMMAQFIVDENFPPVKMEGPFAKENFEAEDMRQREELITRGWRRLQELPQPGLAIGLYPLPEVVARRELES